MKRIIQIAVVLVAVAALSVAEFKPLKKYFISVPMSSDPTRMITIKAAGDSPEDALRRAGIRIVDESTEKNACVSLATLGVNCDELPSIDMTCVGGLCRKY